MIQRFKEFAVVALIQLRNKLNKTLRPINDVQVMLQPTSSAPSFHNNRHVPDYMSPMSCLLSSPYYSNYNLTPSSWDVNSLLSVAHNVHRLSPNNTYDELIPVQASRSPSPINSNFLTVNSKLDERPSSNCSADSGVYVSERFHSTKPRGNEVASSEFGQEMLKNKENVSKNKSVSGAGSKRQHNVASFNSIEDNASQQQPPQKKPFIHNSNRKGSSKAQSRHWENLSSEIWQNYLDRKQDNELYGRKMKLWNFLFNLLKETFPYCGLYVVGSSMTGLGSSSSDVDMCLMLSHQEIDQKNDAMKILKFVAKIIKSKHIQNPVLIRAKVPILNFYDAQSDCNVDLNINNAVGIRNTQLLKCYADCDWRVRPLVLVIKSWAQKQGINDAKSNTLSSYSIVLMIIHFLQYGVEPSVLPCLQKLYPNKFVPDSDVRTLSLNEHLPIIPSKNKMSLGELLHNFFDYYANNFNFSKDTVSVRLGCVVPKYLSRHQPSLKNTPSQWNLLCIEEPFDYTNTARSVYEGQAYGKIIEAFRSSHQNMKKNKSLNSILLQS